MLKALLGSVGGHCSGIWQPQPREEGVTRCAEACASDLTPPGVPGPLVCVCAPSALSPSLPLDRCVALGCAHTQFSVVQLVCPLCDACSQSSLLSSHSSWFIALVCCPTIYLLHVCFPIVHKQLCKTMV